MATFTLKPLGGVGADLGEYDITSLAGYDDWQGSSTTVRFFDDPSNYTRFTGTGIKFSASGNVLTDISAGIINTMDLSIGGVKVLSVTGLNLSAARLFDFYQAGNPLGAVNYLLSGDDTINGTSFRDVLKAGAGNDRVLGNSGNDALSGGSGMDTLRGGNGDDVLGGGTDDDQLYGDAGTDTLKGDAGADKLYGGDGNDRLYGGAGNDALSGGAGNDKLYGDDDSDKLLGGLGDDLLDGGNGNDLL